jgi:hypothetical protein
VTGRQNRSLERVARTPGAIGGKITKGRQPAREALVRCSNAKTKLRFMRPFLAAGLVVLSALAQSQPTAIEQLNTLQKKGEAAAKAGDQATRIAAN